MIRVVHVRNSYTTYIGRGSKWGNKFRIGIDGTREECIEKFRTWLPTQSKLMAALPELVGETLGCHCKPKACHGDVLKEFAERELKIEK